MGTGTGFSPDCDATKLLYTEICNSCGRLLDIRFKLLGLVPSVSLGVLAIVLNEKPASMELRSGAKLGLSLMGLMASIGLLLYEKRNTQVFSALKKRGEVIEQALRVEGQFSGGMPTGFISHGRAVGLIYMATILGWLFPIFAILSKYCLCQPR